MGTITISTACPISSNQFSESWIFCYRRQMLIPAEALQTACSVTHDTNRTL